MRFVTTFLLLLGVTAKKHKMDHKMQMRTLLQRENCEHNLTNAHGTATTDSPTRQPFLRSSLPTNAPTRGTTSQPTLRKTPTSTPTLTPSHSPTNRGTEQTGSPTCSCWNSTYWEELDLNTCKSALISFYNLDL